MPFLPLSNILSLRKELEGTAAEIVTWGSDGYGDGVKQWSDTCDEQVVSSCYQNDTEMQITDPF
jgi:hypothetical protein